MSATVTTLRVDTALRTALGPISLLLRDALGPIPQLIDDDTLTDLMVNEDGAVWIDRLRTGRVDTGQRMTGSAVKTALCLLANHCGVPLTAEAPILSATMPSSGERVAGTIPPVTSAPTLAIRRPPRSVFSLDAFSGTDQPETKYDDQERPPANCALDVLRYAVNDRKNIIICGSTGSGKTSLASALLSMPEASRDRMVICEDTHELATSALDMVRFMETPNVNMRALVKLALRYRPDRIVIGELRDGATAMAYLGALNTGHNGGVCTMHANSAEDALARIEALCGEVCVTIPTKQIRSAIDVIAFVRRTPTGRAISQVLTMEK